MSKVEDTVSGLASPIAEKHGCELWDVEFKKEGASWILRVYIDKPGGVAIDDCENVSKELSPKLDEADPIAQSYCLEVSSPGLDRLLTKDWHFERYKGSEVEVALYSPIDGEKAIGGQLLEWRGGIIRLKASDGREIEIDKSKTASVRLHADF